MVTSEELSFVDKLSKTLEIIGKSLNRSYRLIYGISLILIFLSVGIVTSTNDISFEWINIKLSVPLLLIILSCSLAFVMINCYCLMIEHSNLSHIIQSIYKSYKLNINGLKDDDYEYLSYPDLIEISPPLAQVFPPEIINSNVIILGSLVSISLGGL